MGIKKTDKNYKGINENFSLDNATHSFLGFKNLCRLNCARIR